MHNFQTSYDPHCGKLRGLSHVGILSDINTPGSVLGFIPPNRNNKHGKMAANDEIDFESRFTIVDDKNDTILSVNLTQKKMLFILLVMLVVFFLVLVAFNAIEAKDLIALKDLLVDLKTAQ